MTADERNRRMKFGHDVPRGWIADFQVPAEAEASQERPTVADPSALAANESRDLQVLRRRRRQLLQREQARRLNRDLRRLKTGIALLIALVAYLGAGLPGLVAGGCLALALIAWRLEF